MASSALLAAGPSSSQCAKASFLCMQGGDGVYSSRFGSSDSLFLSPFPLSRRNKFVTKATGSGSVINAKSLSAGQKNVRKGGPHLGQSCRLSCCFKGPLVQRPGSSRQQQERGVEDEENGGFSKGLGLHEGSEGKRRWRTGAVSTDAPLRPLESGKYEKKEQLNWAKQWYPVAVVEDLDPRKPKGIMVLGRRLVLWRDQEKIWQCHLDCCPHRFAPLSEGRIHETGGLQCSYHGWVFGPQGNCTLIPQADEEEQKAVGSKRACAVTFPLQEEAGLLWVWPDEYSSTEARQTSARIDTTLTDPDFVYQWVYRELPYNWDTLVENVLDPAHVNFAHHNVQGKREKAQPITFGVAEAALEGFVVPGDGKMSGVPVPSVSFVAPSSVVYHFTIPKKDVAKPWEASLISLGTPIAPGRVAIFACFPRNFLKLAAKLKPRWIDHVGTRNKVLDGDLILLQGQEVLTFQQASARAGLVDDHSSGSDGQNGAGGHKNGAPEEDLTGLEDRRYFMPTKSDRPIKVFREWVKEFGNGGPSWPAGFRTVPDVLGERPEVILDRFTQHTQHCSACMGAYKSVQRLQTLAKIGVVAAIAGAAAFSARDVGISQGLAVAAVVLAGAVGALQKLEQQFIYVGYDHSKT